MNDKEFLEKLYVLCKAYDSLFGEYPGSPFEGEAVYEWIEETLKEVEE